MADSNTRLGRFGFSSTPRLQKLLQDAANLPHVSEDFKHDCQLYSSSPTVPWKLVQQACCLVSQQQHDLQASNFPHSSKLQPSQVPPQGPEQQPSLMSVCAGSTVVLPSPPPRQRSEALQQRLAKLQEDLETKQYAAMVADITRDEQAAAAAREDPLFPTTKLQLSFGLHVLVTMGTFFALGYYGGSFMLSSQAWAAACGCVGLVSALLLETVLLIVRTNMPPPLEKKYAHLMGKHWQQQQQQQQQQQPQPQPQPQLPDKGRGSSRPRVNTEGKQASTQDQRAGIPGLQQGVRRRRAGA